MLALTSDSGCSQIPIRRYSELNRGMDLIVAARAAPTGQELDTVQHAFDRDPPVKLRRRHGERRDEIADCA